MDARPDLVGGRARNLGTEELKPTHPEGGAMCISSSMVGATSTSRTGWSTPEMSSSTAAGAVTADTQQARVNASAPMTIDFLIISGFPSDSVHDIDWTGDHADLTRGDLFDGEPVFGFQVVEFNKEPQL